MANTIIAPDRDMNHAMVLLEDPMIKGFFIEYEAELIEQFKESGTSAERDAIHAQLRALEKMSHHLRQYIVNGKLNESRRKE